MSPTRTKKTVLEIAETPIDDADDLAGRFRALIDVLPADDGVRRFCEVHEVMSVEVAARLEEGGFLDPDGLERMDILIVARFFEHVARWERAPKTIGKAWEPLFAKRADRTIHPIRFAVAGIHAHVASDLVWAVLETHRERNEDPEQDSPLHKDYCAINGIELRLRDKVEEKLGDPEWKKWDDRLGTFDDLLRSWSFARARDKAWFDAYMIAREPNPLDDLHRHALDRTTGFANRIFLR